MNISTDTQLKIFGAASCWGAQNLQCEYGPDTLKSIGAETILSTSQRQAKWQRTVRPSAQTLEFGSRDETVFEVCQQIAVEVRNSVQQHAPFVVFGGDHSCAVGTWSGLRMANPDQSIGLIWIDAHMDSHIPETSPSGNLHGMPLACLLGHGDKRLVGIGGISPKLLPQNICLIGIRSYESGEEALLKLLGVRVFLIEEVKRKGLDNVLKEAKAIVTANTDCYGISIDLDAIDPRDAPGVGSPAPNGIRAAELINGLQQFRNDRHLAGVEVTELNPANDVDDKTAQLAITLVKTIYA